MHQILFGVFSLLVLSVHSWEYYLTVDARQRLKSTNDCIHDSNNTFLCATINSALRNLKYNSTVIYIKPGNYTLRNGEETDITGKQDIAIIGSGKDSIITCTEHTGLGVLYSVNITIESIVMKGCGKKQDYDQKCKVMVYVALYFESNNNITLFNVVLMHSKGVGIFLNDRYDYFQSNFNIDSCKVLNGSVAESSQNSIAGGLVINTLGSGTIHLSNFSIINNGGGTQSHDAAYCSPIGSVAGIVVIELSAKLIIDSCNITNNTRGFLVYDGSADICISNTVSNNHLDNAVVYNDRGNVRISLYGVTLHKFTIVVPTHFSEFTWQSSADSYSFGNDFLNIYVGYESRMFSLQLIETGFNNCYFQGGTCSNTPGQNYSGHCPPSYSECSNNYCSCSEGRNGTLCGQCVDGYSVAINSPYMSCVPCNSSTVYKGWALLIALEFIPITVMVAIIAVLNVNLNQGSLNGYILLCQMITIPFPSVGYPSWLVSATTLYNYNQNSLFFFIPLNIWNIGFIYYPSYYFLDYPQLYNPSICISQSTTPLAYLLFWYVISFYPLVLALLTYCVMVMYDKGYKCVVCVVRPIHHLLARFWRLFGIQHSLSHTVASLYTLCFTQLAATSLKILHRTVDTDTESENHSVRFFYDGSQSYFSGVHGFSGIVAILVLVGLSITVAYLLLHPFKLFQKCFGKLKFRKDFIISVTDVFNGPFKDGTSENSWDCRYFAGMHFIIQLEVMTFYYIPLKYEIGTGILKMIVCSLYICSILIFRPYKKNVHNFSEVVVFLLLIIFSVFPAIYYPKLFIDPSFFLIVVICLILIIVVIPYCLIWMIRKCCHCCKYVKGNFPNHKDISMEDHEELITNYRYVHSANDEECFVVPDRLENPKKYNVVIKRGSKIST